MPKEKMEINPLISPACELIIGASDVQLHLLHPHADVLVVVEPARLELEIRVVPVDDGSSDAVVPDTAQVEPVLRPARTPRGGGGPVCGIDSVGVLKREVFLKQFRRVLNTTKKYVWI